MKRLSLPACSTMLLCACVTLPCLAQNGVGMAAVSATVNTWVKDWNAHDAKAIGKMLAPDVDFVLVNGRWLKGRSEFVQVHGDQFAGRYAQSEFAVDGTPSITMLKPDVALVQWRWIITRVRNPDGTPAPTYKGVFTWVLTEQSGAWSIRAAQNTVTR
jgi:uncharacterized protein (TIGR02246 family)